jgi:DNA repair protein RecO (recombination protein O)
VVAGTCYEYRLESGPVRCDRPLADAICLDGASLLALRDERLDDPQVCREIRLLTRAALALYLGARPLRTRTVSRQLSALARGRVPGTGEGGQPA